MTEVLSIVLGGGKGTRLFPLTQSRAKPAVPFGGKFRACQDRIQVFANGHIGIVPQFSIIYLSTSLFISDKFMLFSYKLHINFHKTIDKK